MEPTLHPVQANVQVDVKLSRLLIFVKGVLLIPHFIALYVLQMVSAVLTFIAWFAILFTAKYPRGMFDFSVGVLRWQWRVMTYMTLLTDKYPPFSLSPDPAFPATYDVVYPERLSRLLIFVKWILAIPHFIALWLLSIAYLIVIIIAWFAILFTGQFPSGLAKFAIGFMRWNARVGAYLMLLTDVYPPFSLD